MHDINNNLQCISIASVGDISFRGRHESAPNLSTFKHFKPLFEQANFVIANLESPLVSDTSCAIPGKCTLRGATRWAEMLKNSGVSLVTLANNHMMDFGVSGLTSTIQALDNAGILYVGAGMDAKSANAPIIKEISGIIFAFLGRSSVVVSTPCYASSNQPGVALFDEDELIQSVKLCKKTADQVVVMLHWGIEDYHYPSPEQKQIAKKIVSAGASIILGHHPHVLQGEEIIDGSIISYSSGNFLFDDFIWTIQNHQGNNHNIKYHLKENNRQGMMLEINIPTDGKLSTKRTFSRISDESLVLTDNRVFRKKQYHKLCSLLHVPFYSFFWTLYSTKREWDLRVSKVLSPIRIFRNLHKIRLKHFQELFKIIRRSVKLLAGKSTNPYED